MNTIRVHVMLVVVHPHKDLHVVYEDLHVALSVVVVQPHKHLHGGTALYIMCRWNERLQTICQVNCQVPMNMSDEYFSEKKNMPTVPHICQNTLDRGMQREKLSMKSETMLILNGLEIWKPGYKIWELGIMT